MRKPRRRICTPQAQPLQVAAVCYRHKAGSTRFLLVRTTSGRWTFPKGHLEDDLFPAQVAALEAFEESGVAGELDPRPIGTYVHRKESPRGRGSKDVAVIAFLLEVRKSALPTESYRTPRWFTPSQAKQRLVQRRPSKYLHGIERVVDLALSEINRKHSRS